VGLRRFEIRRVVGVLVALVLCFLPAACSSGSGGSGSAPETTLDKVKAAGVLRIGTEGTYSPFSYHDPTNNQLTGYDVEVIEAVAAKMGLRTEFVEAPFDSIFASLQSDRFDLVANQVTKNAQREATYALSDPYTVSDGVIVTRTDDSSITSLADLKGKTTAQSSTSNWAQVAKDAGAKVEAVEGFTQAVTLVKPPSTTTSRSPSTARPRVTRPSRSRPRRATPASRCSRCARRTRACATP
jgi:cystine transport system substrate-binding protein